MLAIIAGNVLSLVATVFGYLNGTRKNKRDMIICDMGAAISYTLADLVLKGYSGVVQNVVGVLRNLTVLFMPKDKYIGWFLVVCGVVLGVYFNNKGLIGLMPVVSSLWYSICVIDRRTSHRKMKMALIINSLAFGLYSAVLFNLVGVCTNSFVVITALRSYLREGKETKQ